MNGTRGVIVDCYSTRQLIDEKIMLLLAHDRQIGQLQKQENTRMTSEDRLRMTQSQQQRDKLNEELSRLQRFLENELTAKGGVSVVRKHANCSDGTGDGGGGAAVASTAGASAGGAENGGDWKAVSIDTGHVGGPADSAATTIDGKNAAATTTTATATSTTAPAAADGTASSLPAPSRTPIVQRDILLPVVEFRGIGEQGRKWARRELVLPHEFEHEVYVWTVPSFTPAIAFLFGFGVETYVGRLMPCAPPPSWRPRQSSQSGALLCFPIHADQWRYL